MTINSRNERKRSAFSNLIYGIRLFENRSYVPYWIAHLIIATAIPFISAYIPSLVIKVVSNKIEEGIIYILAFVIAATLLQTIDNYLTGINSGHLIGSRIDLSGALLRKYMNVPVRFCQSDEGQKMMSKARRNVLEGNDIGYEAFLRQFPEISVNLVSMVIEFIFLARINLIFSIVILLSGVTILFVSEYYGNKMDPIYDEVGEVYGRERNLHDSVLDNDGQKDIYIFNLRKILVNKMKRYATLAEALENKSETLYEKSQNISTVLSFIRDAYIYVSLILLIKSEKINVSDFIFIAGIIEIFAGWLEGFFLNIREIISNNIIMNDFRNFMELPDEDNSDLTETNTIEDSKSHTIKLDHIWFKYPGGEDYVIKDLSVEINAGENIALVGLNGAGKSTLVELILGIEKPERGYITLDGVDIFTVPWEKYINNFTAVFQNVFIFAGSIEENIACSTDIDDSKVEDALRKSMLQEKIEALPLGPKTELTTEIDENGINLSGGQAARISLARAIYRNRGVLILDEPTAAMDPIAEEKLYKQYAESKNGRTSIFISHRLISTRFCDSILLMKDGRIIESGSHDELLELKGEYYNLFELQASKYREKGEID